MLKSALKTIVKSLFVLALASLIAGIYGIIHDQITITISLDYFLYFKGLYTTSAPYRLGAAFIGWSSTWWVGFWAAAALIIALIIKKQSRGMVKRVLKEALIIMGIAAVSGAVGGILGYLIPVKVDFFYQFALDHHVENYAAFFSVWMIHIFGYAGGLLGAAYRVIRILKYRKGGDCNADI